MPLGVAGVLRGVPRSRRGLWGGKTVLHGKYTTEFAKKIPRVWKPNLVKNKKLFSEALDRSVRLTVTASVLRHIDHVGGLDNYLLRTPDKKLFSDVGSDLKYQIGLLYKQRWAAENAERKRQAAPAAGKAQHAFLEAKSHVDRERQRSVMQLLQPGAAAAPGTPPPG